jgi:sporulation protein YlmC with PRC-barrel domain
MKSLLLGCIAATTLGLAVAGAQAADTDKTAQPPAATPTTSAASTTAGKADFIAQQETGLVRAPKLVGVAVYDSNNKSVGKVADLLLDKSGEVKAVVIGVGGFLGIGSKDIALPYSAVHWQTEERSVATNGQAPGAAPGGAMTGDKPAAAPPAKKIDAAETETYQGYPDRAVVDLSQDQLKAAPEFKYAQNPETKAAGDAAPATTTTKQ